MNTFCSYGKSNVDTVINNQRNIVLLRQLVNLLGKLDILHCGFIFLTELQDRRTAFECFFYTVEELCFFKARGISYKVKFSIKVFHIRSLYVEVIVQHGLKSFSLNILIHLVKAAVIVNFKLLVTLSLIGFFSAVFAFMVADARRNTC